LQKSDLNHLVTKGDLKAELKDMELRLMKWNASVVGIGVAILALLKFP